MGIRRFEKSETILITAVVMMTALMFTQDPPSIGFQIFARGVHSKISASTSAVKKSILDQMMKGIR